MYKPNPIPLKEILTLYEQKGMTIAAAARHLGITPQAISYRLKKAGIATNPILPEMKFPSKETIERLYLHEGLTMTETAERLNVTVSRITRAMKWYGIKRRKPDGVSTPKFPQLRKIAVGESLTLPITAGNKYVSCYEMAKKAGIRVSVHIIDDETVLVTRKK